MRHTSYFLEGLLDLPSSPDPAERRAAWRQSIVALSQALAADGPGPLEGVHPGALVPAVRTALADGLVDDLTWLAPESAAVALYEIAAALPSSPEKREVGRRVAAQTYDGTADTFAAVATCMALGSGKGLAGASLKARVALCLALPTSAGTRIDAMAFALASRRDLSREWIVRPSSGALPARRTAARLLERAAAEAVRRAERGDEHALVAFDGELARGAWQRLLADREPLVWRHVAVARGALACARGALVDEIERDLDPARTPTEWRRAAVSLAAMLPSDPTRIGRRLRELTSGPLSAADPGVATSALFGLAHAAKVEPEAALELVAAIVARDAAFAAEPLAEAVRDEPSWLGTEPVGRARKALVALQRSPDDGLAALAADLAAELADDAVESSSVRRLLGDALATFAVTGARAAHVRALDALEKAREAVAEIDRARLELDGPARRALFGRLRDVDAAILESSLLRDLLSLDRRVTDDSRTAPAVDQLSDHVATALLAWEAGASPDAPEHPTDRLRKLRALLHALDTETGDTTTERGEALAARWRGATRLLLGALDAGVPALLERSLGAALARSLDGLVRAEACDPVDVLLVAGRRLGRASHFALLAEASMRPDLSTMLAAFGRFASAVAASDGAGDALTSRLAALDELARTLADDGEGRAEALRVVLVRLHRALVGLAEAPSLVSLATGASNQPSLVQALEVAAFSLLQLSTAARQRLADEGDLAPRSLVVGSSRRGDLAAAFDRAAFGPVGAQGDATTRFMTACRASLPRSIVDLLAAVLERVERLPPASVAPDLGPRRSEVPLPAWVPARRTLGGFSLLRPIGSGAVGSVFVARRYEDRADPDGERFALKVPEFDAAAARHLTEAEFQQMFRDEASALLSLPVQPNLARFVTFDLAARPKPILVMELVEGPTLETTLAVRKMSTDRAVHLLDGVLAGLEAMHRVGVGHLDLKPSNVILRDGREPVLVDFGLAGRRIRPGCGSAPYGAPEVWGVALSGHEPSPLPADVYSLSCLGFELLTGRPLFDQEHETSLIAAHVAHDGWPSPLAALYRVPPFARLAQLLAAGLRRDPRERATIAAMRSGLRTLSPEFSSEPWPLGG